MEHLESSNCRDEPPRKRRKLNVSEEITFKPVQIIEGVDISSLIPLLNGKGSPVVLRGYISEWKASSWTFQSLANLLGSQKTDVRFGPIGQTKKEIDCEHRTVGFDEFLDWISRLQCKTLEDIDISTNWGYLSYKHFENIDADLSDEIDFSQFVVEENSSKPVLWVGSEGAHTPGHYDTYGYNFVAQIHGVKRWILAPPHSSPYLYPTRIPFEESSVFSEVDFHDITSFPQIHQAELFRINLMPGDVLYVPHHWWHFVETMEASISVNLWIDTPHQDTIERQKEALCRTLVTSLQPKNESWFNSNVKSEPIAKEISILQSANVGANLSENDFLKAIANIVCSDEILEHILKELLMQNQQE